MVKLPMGFSPVRAVQQVGSFVNPTGGVTNYDVFSDRGEQRGGQQNYGSNPQLIFDSKVVSPYLDQGWSYEDIANATGYDYNQIRSYADNTRPGYGITAQNATQPNPYTIGGTDAQEDERRNQAISLYQGQLDRLPGQLDIAYGNVENQFNTRQNELQSGFNQAQNTYNTQSTQNRQNLVTNRNNINDQASQGLRGLMRLLGAYGAGGSSDRFNAGEAVTSTANQQLSGAGQTYSGNQSALDTNWGNFKLQDENEKRKLADWRTQQRQGLEQQSLSTKQDLLGKLAALQQSAGEAQPYIDQISGLSSRIDQLGAFNPTYTGNTPVYQVPTLDSYNLANQQVAVQDNGSSTPFLSLLTQDERRKRV